MSSSSRVNFYATKNLFSLNGSATAAVPVSYRHGLVFILESKQNYKSWLKVLSFNSWQLTPLSQFETLNNFISGQDLEPGPLLSEIQR